MWDSRNLYLTVTIRDNFPRFVDLEKIKESTAFFDYGTIEDEKGKVVWKMRNFFAKHAGGARKNRLVDTVIHMGPGKYRLRYATDESHSWGNWDAPAPKTPFYGVVLFEVD